MNVRTLLQKLKSKSNVTLVAYDSEGQRLCSSDIGEAADREDSVCAFVVFNTTNTLHPVNPSEMHECYYCSIRIIGNRFEYRQNDKYSICVECWVDANRSLWKLVSDEETADELINISNTLTCHCCDEEINHKRYVCRYNDEYLICSSCWRDADRTIWKRIPGKVTFRTYEEEWLRNMTLNNVIKYDNAQTNSRKQKNILYSFQLHEIDKRSNCWVSSGLLMRRFKLWLNRYALNSTMEKLALRKLAARTITQFVSQKCTTIRTINLGSK